MLNKFSPLNLSSNLYIVATPIGNCKDITIRAVELLGSVDAIICEDTRVTNKLLAHYNIKKKLYLYNDHSGAKERDFLLSKMQNGEKLALVSDAGTPLISDPGYKLLEAARARNISIDALPGPCAAINDLVLSGLPNHHFSFIGYLPHSGSSRSKILSEFLAKGHTIILYEAPHRMNLLLEELLAFDPEIEIAIIREMTKTYQEVIKGKIGEIYQKNKEFLGEIVVVIDSMSYQQGKTKLLIEKIREELQLAAENGISLKAAVAFISKRLQINRKIVYNEALSLKEEFRD